jgi:hypothetical protein
MRIVALAQPALGAKSQFRRNLSLLRPQGIATVRPGQRSSPLFETVPAHRRVAPSIGVPLTDGDSLFESWRGSPEEADGQRRVTPERRSPERVRRRVPSHPLGDAASAHLLPLDVFQTCFPLVVMPGLGPGIPEFVHFVKTQGPPGQARG